MSAKASASKVKRLPNATVFSQKPERLTVRVLRSILTSYGQRLKARELRANLLERVVALEDQVSYRDAETISQLLADKVEVTRAAIEAGRRGDYDPFDVYDSDLDEDERYDEYGGTHGQQRRREPRESEDHIDEANEVPARQAGSVKGKKIKGVPRAQAGETRDRRRDLLCNICYNKQAPQNFRDNLPHPTCSFKRMRTCETCMENSINGQLKNRQWDKITCPIDDQPLSADVVRQYASVDVLPKYNAFIEIQSLRKEPNFRWCSSSECRSGQIHDAGVLDPKMTCKECFFVTCFTHERPWHEEQSCEEFEKQRNAEQKKQEKASEENVKKTSAPCPSCSARITKIDGCGTVRCRCGHSFDWYAAMGQESDGTLALH